MHSYECRGLRDILEVPSSPRSGRIKSFIGTIHENNGRTQALAILSAVSQDVFTSTQREGLTTAKLKSIIDSSQSNGSIVSEDTISLSSQGSDCTSEWGSSNSSISNDSSRCSSSSDKDNYAVFPLSPQLSEQSNSWHEQRRKIDEQRIEVVKLSQKLESSGCNLFNSLDRYFPTIQYELRLAERPYGVYNERNKKNVEDLQLEVETYENDLARYVDIENQFISYIAHNLGSSLKKDLNKYKLVLKEHKDFFIRLQTALKEFSEQLAKNKTQVQNIITANKAIIEIADMYNKDENRILDEFVQVKDIVDNPQLAQDIAKRSKIARGILGNIALAKTIYYNRQLVENILRNQKLAKDIQANSSFARNVVDSLPVERLQDTFRLVREDGRCMKDNHALRLDIDKNRELVRNLLRNPHITGTILDNLELAKEIAPNCHSGKILDNWVIAQYIVDHPDVFQGIKSVSAIKEKATVLYSKMCESQKKLSQLLPVLFADEKSAQLELAEDH